MFFSFQGRELYFFVKRKYFCKSETCRSISLIFLLPIFFFYLHPDLGDISASIFSILCLSSSYNFLSIFIKQFPIPGMSILFLSTFCLSSSDIISFGYYVYFCFLDFILCVILDFSCSYKFVSMDK